jgi:hypothetical protein
LAPTGRTEKSAPQPSGKLADLAQKDPELSAALTDMQKKGGASQAAEERDKIVNMMTTKYNMDKQEAANLVQQWNPDSQAPTQTEQKSGEVAGAATRGLASGALWGFIALTLGLLFAAWGGWAGTASLVRNVEVVKTA